MANDIDPEALRVLSLLHALGDKEELIHEAVRLLLESNIGEAAWARVRRIGRDIAPRHPLFHSDKTLEQLRIEFAGFKVGSGRRIRFDRRKWERRTAKRRSVPDRRTRERRTSTSPWQGEERRKGEQRRSARRLSDV
jgi:hypothetical protein